MTIPNFINVTRLFVTRPADPGRKMLVALDDIKRVEDVTHDKHKGVHAKLLIENKRFFSEEFVYVAETFDEINERMFEASL